VALLWSTDDVLLVVCTDRRDDAHPLLVRPSPICLPPLSERASKLPRIGDEYALDAIAELGAPPDSFTDADRARALEHAAESLAEIQKATLRLVALRVSRSMSGAAARLGMAPVSLIRVCGAEVRAGGIAPPTPLAPADERDSDQRSGRPTPP
jgi:hypothetical protein